MDLLPEANITAGALDAEKLRMEVIAQNIANANTTKTGTGEPYRRKMITFEARLDDVMPSVSDGMALKDLKGVQVGDIKDDMTPFKSVYNPGHPHADENGMVKLPNVNMATEMVDMISSSRSYEANLAVMRTSRQLAKQAININF